MTSTNEHRELRASRRRDLGPAISMATRRAGFVVPMGGETDGPAFGTYDDFRTYDSDGGPGAGFFEQGIVHRVY